MTIKGLVAGLVLFLALVAPPSLAQDKALRHKVYDASLQLYLKADDPNHKGQTFADPGCTATAFQKTPTGFLIVTAGHCAVFHHEGPFSYDEPYADGMLSIGYGDPGNDNELIPVTIKVVGNWQQGWDCAILEAVTKVNLTVIPLGDDTKLDMGDKVMSVSAPLGGGIKEYYEGFVSATVKQIDPDIYRQIRSWGNSIFLQIGGTFGSSGASIISVDQQAIVGVFTGESRGGEPTYDRLSGVMFTASGIKELMAHPAEHNAFVPVKK
jgi:Trypsin-like peptidase domain